MSYSLSKSLENSLQTSCLFNLLKLLWFSGHKEGFKDQDRYKQRAHLLSDTTPINNAYYHHLPSSPSSSPNPLYIFRPHRVLYAQLIVNSLRKIIPNSITTIKYLESTFYIKLAACKVVLRIPCLLVFMLLEFPPWALVKPVTCFLKMGHGVDSGISFIILGLHKTITSILPDSLNCFLGEQVATRERSRNKKLRAASGLQLAWNRDPLSYS